MDNDREALKAYEVNFPDADIYAMNISEFLEMASKIKNDVLHFSPPCQSFSKAQRTPGEKDENKLACLRSIAALVQKSELRVVIIKEVAGLRSDHHEEFATLVGSFNACGLVHVDEFQHSVGNAQWCQFGTCTNKVSLDHHCSTVSSPQTSHNDDY